MSAQPIDVLVAAQERLQRAIASYVAVAEQVLVMLEEDERAAEGTTEMEGEQ